MEVLVNWTYDSDILECPNDLVKNLINYQMEFDKYCVDKDVEVTLENLIEFVNKSYLCEREDKIVITARGIFPTEEQKKLPHIFF